MEGIAFLIGLISGIAICYYHDLKYNPYMKGYGDGYAEAMDVMQKELKTVLENKKKKEANNVLDLRNT